METQRLVVVTGGASGIGLACAGVLLDQGYRVVVVDIAPCNDTAASAAAIWPEPVDISDEQAVAACANGVEQTMGPVCGLVNAAGILGKMHHAQKVRMENWDREFGVDLRGTFLACRHFGGFMLKRGHGTIVNIASIAGMSPAPAHAYAAAKAGVIQLTAGLAAEWGRSGVRVNAVSPGFTRTPALEEGIRAGVLDAHAMTSPTALGRFVEPGEIAQAVAWLTGPLSSGVTGVNLAVDAGFLAGVTSQAYGRPLS